MLVRFLAPALIVWGSIVGGIAPLHGMEKPEAQDPRGKVAAVLRDALAGAALAQAPSHVLRGAAPARLLMRVDATPTPELLAAITTTGATVLGCFPRWHEIDIDATPAQALAIAPQAAVHAIHPLRRPRHHLASITDQADGVLMTDQLRTLYGADGQGTTLGIISDSLNHTADMGAGTTTGTIPRAILTNTTLQRTGALPPSILLVDPGPRLSSDTDEGAAMMAEAYQLAPGAQFAFATCGSSQSALADNITALRTAGCHILCDDILFFDEPMFQDGPAAQAITAVTDHGGLYFSAAGNDADHGILLPYTDVNPGLADVPSPTSMPTGADFLDWGIGGATPGFLPVTITPRAGGSAQLVVVLQWNQPYHSYGLGAGAEADYDLYLFSSTISDDAHSLSVGGDLQGSPGHPSGDPCEIADYTITQPTTIYLAVNRYAGNPAMLRLMLSIIGGTLQFPKPPTGYPAATIYGHPATLSACAVAAVPYTDPLRPESFTSFGGWDSTGIPMYFDGNGQPLAGAPQRRNKPDVAAPDGTTNPLASFSPFYGTSAAAPHAAAAAALLRQILPRTSNTQLLTLLSTTATDITAAPATSGPDGWSGAGLINPLRAATTTASTTVTNLTSMTPNTVVTHGEVILHLDFTQAVSVLGTPTLHLATTPARQAVYRSGSGTATLTFAYAVQDGDTTLGAALDIPNSTALSASNGTLTDAQGQLVQLAMTPGVLATSHTVISATHPTLTITSPTVQSLVPTFPITCVFSQPVIGFSAADIAVTHGTVSDFQGTGTTFTATITALQPGAVTVTVAAGAATDSQGATTQGATLALTYGGTSLGCSISAPATAVSGSSVIVTFQFTSAVTDFTADLVTLTNATAGTLTGSGTQYTVPVTMGHSGTVTILVPANRIHDALGNTTAAATTATITVTEANPAPPGASSSHHGCGLGGIGSILAGGAFLVARTRRRWRGNSRSSASRSGVMATKAL